MTIFSTAKVGRNVTFPRSHITFDSWNQDHHTLDSHETDEETERWLSRNCLWGALGGGMGWSSFMVSEVS